MGSVLDANDDGEEETMLERTVNGTRSAFVNAPAILPWEPLPSSGCLLEP